MRDHPLYAAVWARLLGPTMPNIDRCRRPHRAILTHGVQLDADIQALVRAFWSAGIETYGSCQGDREVYRQTRLLTAMGHVSVGSEEDAAKAAAILVGHSSVGADDELGQVIVTSRSDGADRAWFVLFDPTLADRF